MTLDMFHAPYRFRRLPHLYDPRHLSDVRNIRDRPVSDGRRWVVLHRQKPSGFEIEVSASESGLLVVFHGATHLRTERGPEPSAGSPESLANRHQPMIAKCKTDGRVLPSTAR